MPDSQSLNSETGVESVTEELYKRNVELSVKNKTLSLLSALYEISVQTLSPAVLAEKVTSVIISILGIEAAMLFLYNRKEDELKPLHLALSPSAQTLAEKTFFRSEKMLHLISHASTSAFFKTCVLEHTPKCIDEKGELWNELIPKESALDFLTAGAIKTSMVYPLISNGQIIGVFAVSFNRQYKDITHNENESIDSVANVIAVALYDALLYEELQVKNKELEVANTRLKELDQLKSEFVSIASHQLRSPLTAIKGYASLVLEGTYGKTPLEVKEAVEKIFNSSNNLTLIVEDFLNVSRIEQGKMKYDFAKTNIGDLVKAVVEEQIPIVRRANLTMSYSTDGKDPYTANIDPGKIKQAINNLVDNAIKYTPHGSITVRLSKEQNGMIRVAVTDTGIGMKAETIADLFQKFARAKDANKTNVLGTGLGLYVAKEMIEAHGGRIWAESPGPGNGSTFAFELKELSAV